MEPEADGALSDLPRTYRDWRASRLGQVTDQLELALIGELCGPIEGRQALDVGCGDGALTVQLSQAGAEATGLDSDLRMLAAARRRLGPTSANARFLQGDALSLPFPDRSFDVVVAVALLCLVPDPGKAVSEMARVLRPGGRLVLGDLGRDSLWAAGRRIRGWLGSPTWRSARFWRAAELRRLIEGAGLEVREVRGAIFYPPAGWLAALAAGADPWLGRRTTLGAAFVALSADR